MLTTLKAKMRNDVEFRTSLEAASEYISENNDDIKDVFLDDPDALVIGAENDPEIAKLVDSLPDDPDVEEVTEKDIEELVEGFIPETMLAEGMVTESIEDGYEDGDSGDDDEDEDDLDESFDDLDFDDIDFVEEGEQADAHRAKREAEREKEHQDNIKSSERYVRQLQHQGVDSVDGETTRRQKAQLRTSDRGRELSGMNKHYEKELKKTGTIKPVTDKNVVKASGEIARSVDAMARHERRHGSKESFEEIEDFDFDDFMLEADFDNILATKQDEVEDATDKTPTKSQPCTKNIDGEDQEEIEDAPDKDPSKSTPNTKNIKGEEQDTIEDVGESFDDFEFNDFELDVD